MKPDRKGLRCARAVAALLVLLAGCGSVPAASHTKPAPSSPAAASTAVAAHLTNATLRLPYTMNGNFLAFLAAKAEGYYKAAGFNVTIAQGKGSAITSETVGNGSDTFGVADAGTAALLISKGLSLKVIAAYIQVNPAAFIYNSKYVHLARPQDLKGQTVIEVPGGASSTLLKAVLARNHIPPSDIHVVSINPGQVESFLASHRHDIGIGLATESPLYSKLDPNAKYVLFGQLGVNTYSQGLITDLRMVKDHPGEVKRFVAATNKGWDYTLKHPNQVAKLAKKAFPQAPSPKLMAAEFSVNRGLLHTPRTKGRPLGWMSRQDWLDGLHVLHKYGGLKTVRSAGTYYTDAFIPKS